MHGDDRRQLPFGPSPWDDGLTYPGPWPEVPTLLDSDRLVVMDDDAVDASLGAHAVLAVGSNGSPAQLHRKLREARLPVRVPIIPVDVDGLASVFTTWAAPYGAVPATAAAHSGTARLVVTVLDDAQAAAIDATEGGYQRRVLDPDAHPVRLAGSARPLPAVSCYVADHGVLVDPASGQPVTLRPQAELWGWLLATVAGLADLVGSTPAAAVAALAGSSSHRRTFGDLLHQAGAAAPAPPPATRPMA